MNLPIKSLGLKRLLTTPSLAWSSWSKDVESGPSPRICNCRGVHLFFLRQKAFVDIFLLLGWQIWGLCCGSLYVSGERRSIPSAGFTAIPLCVCSYWMWFCKLTVCFPTSFGTSCQSASQYCLWNCKPRVQKDVPSESDDVQI